MTTDQSRMKSAKVLNPRLITPKTMHEYATVDTIERIKTGTSLQNTIEFVAKYSSTVHASLETRPRGREKQPEEYCLRAESALPEKVVIAHSV